MIGVYDSGFGGLTVLKHLKRLVPHRDFLYLGDNGRAPYGGRDVQTILDFAEQAVERLFDEGCRLVVVACNTVSCVALRHLQQRYCSEEALRRVLGVTIPGAEIAVATSRGHIAIMATRRTVESGTYVTEIKKLGPHRVTQRAAPVLVPIIEEGWEETDIARLAVARYLEGLDAADTLLLGCTHYPLLLPVFQKVAPRGLTLLDPGPFVAGRLSDWLDRHPGFDAPTVGSGRLRVMCTGDPLVFARHGARFLGEALPEVEPIAEQDGRLAPRKGAVSPMGQVVRQGHRRRETAP
jgi:glutamate racemase